MMKGNRYCIDAGYQTGIHRIDVFILNLQRIVRLHTARGRWRGTICIVGTCLLSIVSMGWEFLELRIVHVTSVNKV